LFIGLSFMKTAMEAQVKFLIFHTMRRIFRVYLLIGFMITVVVQSSSVTMALTLSALHVSISAYRCRNYIGVANRNYH
jgi:phosphate:Na+ symporter